MMGDGFGGGAAMMVFMMLFGLLVVAAVVVGIVFLVRSGSAPSDRPGRSSALEVLQERFARGEIDREEFEERRRALEEG